MMKLQDKYLRMAKELEVYYAGFDPKTKEMLERIDSVYEAHRGEPSYLMKSAIHEEFCSVCELHLFREIPFFFEMSSGRGRFTWGGLQSRAALLPEDKTADVWCAPYVKAIEEDLREGFFKGWRPFGIDHHALGYDTILDEGFEAIRSRAEGLGKAETDERKKAFYTATVRSINALLNLAHRFASEAQRKADLAFDAEQRSHYERIARAAEQVPAKPPRTFYEGVCAILFCREAISSIEGIGVSTFGHFDRMLGRFYEEDLKCGRITRSEAAELIHALLMYTDIRFGMKKGVRETSTTLILGGCDRAGNIVYNDLTRLVLEVLTEGRYIGTKINCRISARHPKEYFENLADVQLANLPVIVLQNDDVIIASRVYQGQAIEDARLYVSGGCHEIVLQNTEVNTRADSWISLPRLLLKTLQTCEEDTFEGFYARYRSDVQEYYDRIISLKNEGERHWCEVSPLPLYSSTLTGCLESGRDATEGGSKYASTALSLLGTATFIDSLYSIKHLVYDTKKLTLRGLRDILALDFDGNEPLRQYIIHRIPKYGTNDDTLNAFSARVLDDLSTLADGKLNARGGKYLPAFYPHDIFRPLGELTGATPDGRRAKTPLSRGCSPSEFIEIDNPLDIIHSLGSIDFTKYADSFCTEMTLPPMEKTLGRNVLTAMITAFLDQGGSSIQFNLLDRERLIEAQKNPEQHADLIVRVCGYSECFVFLNTDQQNEVISRAIR